MRISTFHVPISPAADLDTRTIDTLIDRILYLDENGLCCAYLPEHHFDDYCPYSNNFMLASYLAPQVKQSWLGFSVAVAPLNHPARLAEQINLLHQLTKGRAVFGIGSGGIPLESAGLGVSVMNQSAQTDANLEIVERLWAKSPDDEPIEFKTDYYHGRLVQRVMPAPYAPAPRVLKLAALSPKRIEQAASRAWPAFLIPFQYKQYRDALDRYDHPPEVRALAEKWTSVQSQFHVAETDEQAKAEVMEALSSRQRWLDKQLALQERYDLPNAPSEMPAIRYDSEIGLAITIYGSPETVVRRLKEMEAMGCAEIVMETDFGIHDERRVEVMKRSTQLLAEEVLPHFQTQTAGPAGTFQLKIPGMPEFGKHMPEPAMA